MKGRLIVIEGTDCSGKHTQATKLFETLTNQGLKVKALQFASFFFKERRGLFFFSFFSKRKKRGTPSLPI